MHRQFFTLAPARGGPCWEPPIDIVESGREVVVVRVALPGVAPQRRRGHAPTARSCAWSASAPMPATRATRYIGWKFPTGASSAGSSCRRGRYDMVGARDADGCLVLVAAPPGLTTDERTKPSPAIEARADESRKPAARAASELPYDGLIIIPVRNLVLFPGLIVPLNVARGASRSRPRRKPRARAGASACCCSASPDARIPRARDLYTVGTTAGILRYLTTPDGAHNLVCQGEQRFRVVEFIEGLPFHAARVELLPDSRRGDSRHRGPDAAGEGARGRAARAHAARAARSSPLRSSRSRRRVRSPTSSRGCSTSSRRKSRTLLETFDLKARLDARAALPGEPHRGACACRARSASRRRAASKIASARCCCASS